ncbi:hypothetical protein PG991_004050, partial [Apiospora marii]
RSRPPTHGPYGPSRDDWYSSSVYSLSRTPSAVSTWPSASATMVYSTPSETIRTLPCATRPALWHMTMSAIFLVGVV